MKQIKRLTKKEKELKFGKGAKGRELAKQAKEVIIKEDARKFAKKIKERGVKHGIVISTTK